MGRSTDLQFNTQSTRNIHNSLWLGLNIFILMRLINGRGFNRFTHILIWVRFHNFRLIFLFAMCIYCGRLLLNFSTNKLSLTRITHKLKMIDMGIRANFVETMQELSRAHIPRQIDPDTAEAYAYLAAAWHDFPSKELTVIGITGTDGKTSTINILFDLLKAHGLKVGMISTIKAVFGDEEMPTGLHVTTPAAPDVQAYLRQMVDSGLTHCILESTSHGLVQHRVTAVDFDIAVITNITHEHLDYHGSYEAYFDAKASLFERVAKMPNGRLVLNKDDQSYVKLSALAPDKVTDYSLKKQATINATQIRYTADATTFALDIEGHSESQQVESVLVGEFNVENILAATAVAHVLGLTPSEIAEGLKSVGFISGRMERIAEGQPFLVLVDFAHTPVSLEKALLAGKDMLSIENGRVITVFGSAGKRDVEKRRMMAEAAAQHADITILTAEDPRNESLDDILEMMAYGCRRYNGVEGETFWRVSDRGRAIHFALQLAQPDDIVMICGKGHEQSMCFDTTEYPWDDREATRQVIKAYLAGEETPNLGLPTF